MDFAHFVKKRQGGTRIAGALGAMLLPAAVLFLWDLGCQGKLPWFQKEGTDS